MKIENTNLLLANPVVVWKEAKEVLHRAKLARCRKYRSDRSEAVTTMNVLRAWLEALLREVRVPTRTQWLEEGRWDVDGILFDVNQGETTTLVVPAQLVVDLVEYWITKHADLETFKVALDQVSNSVENCGEHMDAWKSVLETTVALEKVDKRRSAALKNNPYTTIEPVDWGPLGNEPLPLNYSIRGCLDQQKANHDELAMVVPASYKAAEARILDSMGTGHPYGELSDRPGPWNLAEEAEYLTEQKMKALGVPETLLGNNPVESFQFLDPIKGYLRQHGNTWHTANGAAGYFQLLVADHNRSFFKIIFRDARHFTLIVTEDHFDAALLDGAPFTVQLDAQHVDWGITWKMCAVTSKKRDVVRGGRFTKYHIEAAACTFRPPIKVSPPKQTPRPLPSWLEPLEPYLLRTADAWIFNTKLISTLETKISGTPEKLRSFMFSEYNEVLHISFTCPECVFHTRTDKSFSLDFVIDKKEPISFLNCKLVTRQRGGSLLDPWMRCTVVWEKDSVKP
jgi:hypothetical protein